MSPRRARAVRERPGDPATALRAHLLETTERLLSTRSPATLRSREIARAADVSDGVLYNHFTDKTELVLAATVHRFATALDRFRSSIPEPGSETVEANLGRIAHAALDLHLETLPIAAGLLSDPKLLGRFGLEIHREHVGAVDVVLSVERYLAAEQELGRVGAVDTRAAADLLVGAVALRALTTALGVSREDVASSLPGLAATLAAGVEPRP
jgi:AcrR family transcriptional regulator